MISDVTTSIVDLIPTVGTNVIVKVNSVIIANDNGSSSDDVSVFITDNSNNIQSYLAKTIPVPANSSLVVVSKDISVYIDEGYKLRASSANGGRLDATCSYEEIS